MGRLIKEFPFAFALGLGAAGGAAWLSWSWLGILISFIVGLVVGVVIDSLRGERR